MENAIDINSLSADDLKKILKDKQKAEKDLQAKKRKTYENNRTQLIDELGGFADTLVAQMLDLKYESFKRLAEFREQMLEYGTLRRGDKNKGSFEIKNDQYKILFTSQINKRFDERAELAEQKLRTFMDGFIKKRDLKMYNLIKTILERNPKTGDYDIDLINRLYKMEDQFDDQNWKDALRLFKESYNPYGTAQYVRFFKMNTTNNSWEALVLDFAKLNTKNYAPDTEAGNETTAEA